MAIADRMKITQWWWLQDRFWAGVDKRGEEECWPWTKSCVTDGYGTLGAAGLVFATHRIAWEIENGPIPPGQAVLHSCDNPPCCNVKHLFLGTNLDNIKDMIAKKRGSVKLNKIQVEAIKIDERKQHIIATEYNISQSMVSRIKKGSRWHDW